MHSMHEGDGHGVMADPPVDLTIEGVQAAFRARGYVTDRSLATTIFLALELGRPLLLEGEAGVGKTEVAKVLAATLGGSPHPPPVLRGPRRHDRGLRVELPPPDAGDPAPGGARRRRPRPPRTTSSAPTSSSSGRCCRRSRRPTGRRRCCSSTRSTAPTRSSRRTCWRSCPTSRSPCRRSARSAPSQPPRVILTSNRTREVHDALKRRCLYHWIDYPTADKEYAIVPARLPGMPERLARQVVGFVQRLRETELTKVPGVAETLDWAAALMALGRRRTDAGGRRPHARRAAQVPGGRARRSVAAAPSWSRRGRRPAWSGLTGPRADAVARRPAAAAAAVSAATAFLGSVLGFGRELQARRA